MARLFCALQATGCVVAVLLLLLAGHLPEGARGLEQRRRNGGDAKCPPERHAEMDSCAAKMGFLGDHSFTVPKNLTAIEPFCRNVKSSIECLQRYSRDCLEGLTKQLLQALLKRGKHVYSSICQSNSSRQEFVNKLSCLTDDKIEQFHKTMDGSIVRFELIRSAAIETQAKLPALCCSYAIFNRDLDEVVTKICGKRAAKPTRGTAAAAAASGAEASAGALDTHEYLESLVGGTAGEFFSLICESHRSLKDCQQSTKTRDSLNLLEQATRNARAGKTKPQSKSLVPVLLDILQMT